MVADSRTVKGGGAAGVATLGAAGVKVAQNILTETQSAILPLVPYLDTLRWVFIAMALGGDRDHDLRAARACRFLTESGFPNQLYSDSSSVLVLEASTDDTSLFGRPP